MSCVWSSPSHRIGFKICSILWSPSIKISILKFNIRQCLALIYLFTRLLPRRFLSQIIFLLIYHPVLILSRESLKYSVNLLMLTFTHHAFELRRSLPHLSVVTSNLTSPILPTEIFSSKMIWILICLPESILDG